MLRIFVTALHAALPMLATVVVLAWAWRPLYGWPGPRSVVERMLGASGRGVTGSESAGYFIGGAVLSGGIFALGLLVDTKLQRGAQRTLAAAIARIPFVRTVCDFARRFVDLVASRNGSVQDDGGLRSTGPVWCRCGGPGVATTLALLSTPRPIEPRGACFVAMLLPSAPVPVGGLLIYVAESRIEPADIGVEGQPASTCRWA